MVPDPTKTCLGLEYFCFEGDNLWTMRDDELVALASREIAALGLVDEADIVDGAVVRMPKAYPVYDDIYLHAVNVIRDFLSEMPNLYLVGRNGMHKYNNQDHSMLTAMLSVKNILGARYDVWGVNVDNEYHEEVREGDESGLTILATTQPLVPKRIT